MKPVISIIVPVHNVERYLSDCIDSILTQEFTNFEVILVNDGSNDNSGKICDEFAEKDNRVKVVHQNYGGVSSARNVGIDIAQGEFIGFVDSDDRINKEMYKELYRLCIESNSDISICQLGREINGNLINNIHEMRVVEMDNVEALRQLFRGELFRFSLCNKLFKKSCFKNVRFPEGRIHEDLSTTYKLFVNSHRTIFTNYIGYIYIKRENSILTSTFNEKRLDAFKGWDEILKFMMKRYTQLSKETISCFVYWSVDNILYILDQVDDKKVRDNYLLFIQRLIKQYIGEILNNESISISYKYFILLYFINFRVSILSSNFKKIIRKLKQ